MLDYENQMFLDILNEDALVIAAKGLGLEDVMLSLLKVYCDAGNLVLVLGATPHEEAFYLEHLMLDGVSPLPKVITAESGSVAERKSIYLEGGVLFVSPRILIVDLLKERLPIAHLTGVIVCRAHAVVRSPQEAFAVRLYRQKNKTGFVKGFSNSAEAFRAGFCQLGRVMKMLFLKQAFLWPRFHAIVQASLASSKPLVTEMHVEPTLRMTRIQNAILELMAFTVREVKRINPSLDLEELTVENAIAKSFHKVLQAQLDPIWHQLSSKTKTLVADLKILRVFLNYLTRYDCFTFDAFVCSFRTQTYAMHSSGWLLLDAANVLFATAKQRTGLPLKPLVAKESPRKSVDVSGVVEVDSDSNGPTTTTTTTTTATQIADAGIADAEIADAEIADAGIADEVVSLTSGDGFSDSDDDIFASPTSTRKKKAARAKVAAKKAKVATPAKSGRSQKKAKEAAAKKDDDDLLEAEPNPKWLILKQILTEIKDISKETCGDFVTPEKVLILVQDKRTAKQLQEFLVFGARELFSRLRASNAASVADAESRVYRDANARSPTKLFAKQSSASDRDIDLLLSTQMLASTAPQSRSAPESSPVKAAAAAEELRDVYILSQASAGDKTAAETYKTYADKLADLDVSVEPSEDAPEFQPPVVVIQTFKTDGNALSLPAALDLARPRFVVLYDVDVTAIRRIEVYQSNVPSPQVHVYFVVFGGSVEEQAYLTALRREKDAFDALIREKATMVVPSDQDGKSETCESLSRDPASSTEAASSRRGGDAKPAAGSRGRVVVDMREFNSELPAMIHRRGIEIEPVTLQVGDYILTPEMCVERKSVSDLIGSLNNGRLYSQATAMTRYYAKPVLLIEFDENKPLTLQSNFYISKDMPSGDITSKLILLTLHFPQLRIVWSPSPHATAQLFQELKESREEPDAARAADVGADLERDLDAAERYNPGTHDLVARLPGVASRNLRRLLDAGGSLPALLHWDKDKLATVLGNRTDGELFHDGLHKAMSAAEEPSGKRGGRWRGRGRAFRR